MSILDRNVKTSGNSNNFLVWVFHKHWKAIGGKLKVDPNILDAIDYDGRNDEDRCSKLLSECARRVSFTYNDLLTAADQVNDELTVVTKEIRAHPDAIERLDQEDTYLGLIKGLHGRGAGLVLGFQF